MNQRFQEPGTMIVDRAAWQHTQIVRLWNADWSYDQIARKFNLSIDDIESFLRSKPGWPGVIDAGPRPQPKEVVNKRLNKSQVIRELTTKGWSVREISLHTGIHEGYCRNIRDTMLRKNGCLPPKRKIRAQAFNYFTHHPEMGVARIARELNTSVNYIYNLQAQFRKARYAKSNP